MASARLIRRASSQHRRYEDEFSREQEPLLGEVERVQSPEQDEDDRHTIDPRQHFYPNPFADLPVYDSIWLVRRDIIDAINDPYSLDQLRAPRLNTAIVRPLMEKYYARQDISIIFCLLCNRSQFMKETSYKSHFTSVRTTRALLCEILALRLLRQYDDDSSGPDGLLLLANIVIAGFEPFQGAPPKIFNENRLRSHHWVTQDKGGYEGSLTALEVAILSESKLFLSSIACQKVVDAIFTGRIIYTPTSFVDILPDHYKHKPISIYNPRKAPLLNTYRLSVPRIRNAIEIWQFIILLVLYLWLMTSKTAGELRLEEVVFIVFTLGWILDQLASMLEHGWSVYSQNLWSFLDVTFSSIFMVYLIMRVQGLSTNQVKVSQAALDLLAMAAPFLVPRLAFNMFSENLLFVALRDMMSKFLLLTFFAVWSFTGFFLAMVWLDFNDSETPISALTTGLWMVWVWFGLDGTGIRRSVEFHWLLGPMLMISFAILGNTLFLTLLVSTLSESFSKIARRSNGEIQFRRAVLTFEAVKADSIFAYPPPFNILALFTLLPLKLVLTPRWFHKVNITCVRTLNFPLLLFISIWERYFLWPSANQFAVSWGNKFRAIKDFNWFHVHGDIESVFNSPPEGFDKKSSEDMEARRRKSMRVCAPDVQDVRDENQRRQKEAAAAELERKSSQGLASFSATRGSPSRSRRRSSFRAMRRSSAEDTTDTRLARIEEMLEQIGHSLDEGDDDEG